MFNLTNESPNTDSLNIFLTPQLKEHASDSARFISTAEDNQSHTIC